MPPAVRKRPTGLVSREEPVKGGSSTSRKRKKLEHGQPVNENAKKRVSKSKSELASPVKKLKEPKPNTLEKSKNCKPRKKTETRKEKQSVPVEDVDTMDVAKLLALGEKSYSGDDQASSFFEYSSESENSDFEEVKNEEIAEPVIPKEGVDITLQVPDIYKRRKKRGIDLEAHLRTQINRVKRDLQLLMHKVHLLCWIAHLRFVNNTLNTPSLMETCMQLVKSKNLYPSKYSDLTYLEGIVKWFHKNIELKKESEDPSCTGGLLKEISYQLEKKQAFSCRDFIFMFIVLLRVLGLKARIVMSFQVLPVRPPTSELYDSKLGKKSDEVDKTNEASCSKTQEKEIAKENESEKLKRKTPSPKEPKSRKKDKKDESSEENSDDEFESKHFRPSIKPEKRKTKPKKPTDQEISKKETNKKSKSGADKSNKNKESKHMDSDEDEDKDFTPKSLKKSNKKKVEKKFTGESEESKKKEGVDVWTEVYLEAEEKWICVDVSRQKIHCISELYLTFQSRATHPVVYVIACNNDLTLKDVTKRYVPNWHSDTRKRRVNEEWWNDTIKPYLPRKTAQDKEEDEDINRQLSDKPLPAVISEYKDHPLYALKRHLLKFEGIYPPDAPTLGFVRGEPVYARECVVTLRSREIWYKEARVVRLKEEPYKIVKARPKYDKMTGEIKRDLPLELFGFWQTEEYIPPIATDGKVPRNEYGNVDLFKPCMLPIGTVHLQIPGLIRVAKKLNIDCVPATVGFDFHSGGSHPIFDGFVVCEEFKEVLLDTWNKEIDESAKRSEERKEKRVYGNWKRLIRGLLIREKLKIKYAFGENSDEEGASTSKASPPK